MSDGDLSARNLAMVQEVYSRFARGDRAALYEALSPEVTWSSAGDTRLPWSGTRQGPDGVRSYFAALDAEAEGLGYDVEQVIAQGEWIAILACVINRNRRTGETHRYEKADFIRVVDGRVADFREFYDTGKVCRDFALG